ncbi:putative 8-oxo-dgtp diphosphatase nudt15-like, partial [Globisporangium splendens]
MTTTRAGAKLLPPPAPTTSASSAAVAATVHDDEGPKKKRRTLRDAEQELEESRSALQEAKKKLIVTARENAKMKVLLMKYIDKDDSLLCTSQLSMADASQQEGSQKPAQVVDFQSSQSTAMEESSESQSQSPRGGYASTVTTSTMSFEDSENSESSMWTTTVSSSDFQTDDGDGMMMGQVSQLSQMSQWSEFSSTSNLDEIITFLEKQDTVESERYECIWRLYVVTLEADFKELQAQKTCVRVGVGVLLTSAKHPNCVLIGMRKGSHGAGKYALPGGHLEMYESWEECAIREVKEETDLDISHMTFAYVTNDPMEDEGKHYITIFVQATVADDQVPRNMEPHKCEGWHWEPWTSLRTHDNMFLPLYHITRSAFVPTGFVDAA